MVVPVNEYGGSRVAKEVLKYGLGVSGLKIKLDRGGGLMTITSAGSYTWKAVEVVIIAIITQQ